MISLIVLNVVGHSITPGDVCCVTSCIPSGDDLVQLSFLYYSIPLLISGLADSLSFIYALEFICSQAPSNMNGMYSGLFVFFILILVVSSPCGILMVLVEYLVVSGC